MVLKLILYLSFITFSLCILCYRGIARNLGYKLGIKINSKYEFIGGFLFIAGVIECFFEFQWWIVLIGLLLSLFIGSIFTTRLKEKTQWLAPLLVITSFIGIVIYQSLN